MFGTRLLSLTVVLMLIPSAVSAATIHGTVYEWSTFKPLDNALIEVNSTPVQFRVAVSGVYSFNLPPGDYLITTKYYNNDTLEYYSEESISLNDIEGDFVFDILLFPLPEHDIDVPEEDIVNVTLDIDDEGTLPRFNWTYTAGAIVLLLILLSAAYRFAKKDQSVPAKPMSGIDYHHPLDTPTALPDDLKEILAIVSRAGGRITQKELRSKLNCSEAKVSLMITDLEERGKVQKVKKGRGNVILLVDET